MYSDPFCPSLGIAHNALVLDVGSGHRPHPRADVLGDKFIEDSIQRGGAVVADRPLVQCDIQALPFCPNAFDYIIARHVLEHLDDPGAFFRQITRVAKAGYIETPSLIWEYLHPVREFHRWVLVKANDTILMAPKPPEWSSAIIGSVMEELGMNGLEYGLLLRAYKDLFYVRHEWSGGIRYRIYSSIDDAPNVFHAPRLARQSSRAQIKNLVRVLWEGLSRRALHGYLIRREQRAVESRMRRRPVNLADLLMCPVCDNNQIEIESNRACCRNCHWQTAVFQSQG